MVPLTTLSGEEANPSFSPDGEQVVFQWDGEGNPAIYIKLVGSTDVRRLTSGPATDVAPSWSPDGKVIAFLRCKGNESDCPIYVTSPIGGSARKVSDFLAEAPISWTPDSRFVVASRALAGSANDTAADGMYLIPIGAGEPRVLLGAPRLKSFVSPTYTPDGQSLAYAVCGNSIVASCRVEVVSVGASFAPSAAAKQLAEAVNIVKLVWTRDERSVVYESSPIPFRSFLWRVAVDGQSPAHRIELAGSGADPATISSRDRLAFRRETSDEDIYRFQADRPPEAVVTSTYPDIDPEVSPDSQQIAFSSARSAELQDIWIAGVAGEGARQLTHGPGRWQGSPSWSPNGKRVAFDSLSDDGHFHIWAIDADGGEPRQLTATGRDESVPKWSHDGLWLYYSADEGAGRDIWRMSVATGRRTQITNGGSGYRVCISSDDRLIFYEGRDANGKGPLMMTPAAGGSATQLIGCAHSWGFATASSGVYYAACDSESEPTLHVIDPASRRDRVLGHLKDFLNDLRSLRMRRRFVWQINEPEHSERALGLERRPHADRELPLTASIGRPSIERAGPHIGGDLCPTGQPSPIDPFLKNATVSLVHDPDKGVPRTIPA